MNRKSIEDMKLDRRLIRRRGWIAEKDLQSALDALPDVSDKVASEDPDADEPTAEAASAEVSGLEPAAEVPGLSVPNGSDSPLT